MSAVLTDAQATDFPEARQLVKVRNHTIDKQTGQAQEAARHFITSLSAAQTNPQSLHRIIRSHWSCESRHWQRDVCWGEDRCRVRSPNAACALALIRTTLQSLVCWVGRRSLPTVFEEVAHDLSLGLSWLNRRHFHR